MNRTEKSVQTESPAENVQIARMPHARIRILVRTLAFVLVRLLFRLRYEGLEHLPGDQAGILVANHTSMIDMFAIHTRVKPWIHWVAKRELYHSRILGGLLRRLGCIALDRDRADLSAARAILNTLRRGGIIGMFPQGHRVKPEEIGRVKPRAGAVHFARRQNVPILPVAVGGRFRLFSQVRIVFGAPINVAEDPEFADPNGDPDVQTVALMRRVYALIQQPYVLNERSQNFKRRDA